MSLRFRRWKSSHAVSACQKKGSLLLVLDRYRPLLGAEMARSAHETEEELEAATAWLLSERAAKNDAIALILAFSLAGCEKMECSSQRRIPTLQSCMTSTFILPGMRRVPGVWRIANARSPGKCPWGEEQEMSVRSSGLIAGRREILARQNHERVAEVRSEWVIRRSECNPWAAAAEAWLSEPT